MSAQPPIGPAAAEVTTTALDARVLIDVDNIYTRLMNETRRLLADFGMQPLSNAKLAAALERGLESLGTTIVSQAGRGATAEAFNLGRNQAIQDPALLEQVTAVVRTEVLDVRTCPPCRELDGAVRKVNSPLYFEDMPPNKCDGGDFCRGFYLYRVGA